MNHIGRPWETIPRLLRAWLPYVLLLLSSLAAHAQGPGGDPVGGDIPRTSVRPILVDVEFEGNKTVSDEELKSVLQTRPTHIPIVRRYLMILGQVLERLAPDGEGPQTRATRLEIEAIEDRIDSLRGELQLFPAGDGDSVETDRERYERTQRELIEKEIASLRDLLRLRRETYENLKRNEEGTPQIPPFIQQTIDSLGGEVRYLNLAHLETDTINIRKLYNDRGYHEATIGYRIRLDTVRNTSIVRFIIDEGRRFPLRGLTYMGLENIPEDLRETIIGESTIVMGDPFSRAKIGEETERVLNELRNNGYAFAEERPPLVLTAFDGKRFPGAPYDSVLIFIYAGERYRFGETVYSTDTSFASCTVSESLVLAQVEYLPGEWYSKQKIEQTIANLYLLQTFDLVTIDTVAAESSSGTLGMGINVRLRSLNDLRFAPEISWEQRLTEYVTNVGFSSTYTRLNAFCTDGHMTVTGRIVTPLRNIPTRYPLNQAQGGGAVSYLIPSWPSFPILGGRRLSVLFSGSFDATVVDRLRGRREPPPVLPEITLRQQRWAGVTEFTYSFPKHTWFSLLSGRASYQYNKYYRIGEYIKRLADIRVDTTTLQDAGCDTTGVRESVRDALINSIYKVPVLQGDDVSLIPASDTRARENFNALKRTFSLTFTGVADRRNDFFSPTDGYLGEAVVETGVTGGFSGFYLKGELEYRKYWQMLGWTWAGRAHGGYIQEFGPLPLTPASSRFVAGGASSLRGWEARDMLATRPLEVDGLANSCAEDIVEAILEENRRLLGGLALIELNIEVRRRIFDLPNSSTLGRQLNELVMIFFIDAGNAYFRDREDVKSFTIPEIIKNIGLATGGSIGYETPVGPFRIGLGVPVYDPVRINLESRQRWIWNRPFFRAAVVHVGIGHAF